MRKYIVFAIVCFCANMTHAQTTEQLEDKFRQLEEYLPTPNDYRNASGAPGHKYWQQRADYKMSAVLDENDKTITGSAEITYTNNSPDTLNFIWVHLDQNRFNYNTSLDMPTVTVPRTMTGMTFADFREYNSANAFDGGFKITALTDTEGTSLNHIINGSLLRINLDTPMAPGTTFSFNVDWWYNIMDYAAERQGFECFERDENCLFQVSHWFPRMVAYTDYEGWHNKQFQGVGEFALEFGDYDVEITVPADHIVASTGELQNGQDVLTQDQRDRLIESRTATTPMFIVTPNEALENEKSRATNTKTWNFKAENVRDFAFASSRKFIWDALGHKLKGNGNTVMAMSYYPMAAIPTWPKISTHAVAQTLDTFSKHTFDYPYPVAISVNGPVTGMEYPMISFNPTRPTVHPDGTRTYARLSHEALVMVIAHEVGHNWFPMIINSDERQWSWMDEGLASFLQNLTQQEWSENYPLQRIDPRNIVGYMTSTNQRPTMTNPEQNLQQGNNAYARPSTALNILRESIMGNELFDTAFKEYAQRWKFKRPTPADFFRTMEEASGTDLDWFWRGWFYTTDHVDISLDNVRHFTIDTKDPEIEEAFKRRQEMAKRKHPSYSSNDHLPKRIETYPDLQDFYTQNDEFTVTNKQRNDYNKLIAGLEDWQIELLNDDSNIYMLDFTNVGGMIMPIYLEITYEDDSKEERRYPAEIWKKNYEQVTKMIVTDKKIKSVWLDPKYEIADADTSNNHFPSRIEEDRFELRTRSASSRRDMMNENRQEVTPLQDLINKRNIDGESNAEAAARRLIEWADFYTDKGPH